LVDKTLFLDGQVAEANVKLEEVVEGEGGLHPENVLGVRLSELIDAGRVL